MAEATQDIRRKTHRSPEHPALELDRAVELAAKFYRSERSNFTLPTVAMKHLGYSATGSTGMRALAALIHYGLLVYKGAGAERLVGLSELGKNIVLDDRAESPERNGLMAEAALRPRLFRALWEKWGHELPSDDTIGVHLKRDLGFNPDSVDSFIKVFRATMRHVQGGVPGTQGEADEPHEPDTSPRQVGTGDSKIPPAGPGRENITIPLLGGATAVLNVPRPLSDATFTYLVTILNAMKPALVGATPEESAVS